MRFSIVTPSFRANAWLPLCIASVHDQEVELEHIVQDAGSDDGTLDWLLSDSRITPYVEKDQGMYDAVNRGLRRARGEILAYLNCDEQYLPGALRRADQFFQAHPEVDVAFGDVVAVDPSGAYLCHRKMTVPTLHHTWILHLSTLTCGTFFRRRILDAGFFFDPTLRDVGDAEWMVRMLRSGVRMGVLGAFTSVFTLTGANMGAAPNALRESAELARTAPVWARWARPLLILKHRLRRFFAGAYSLKPFTYAIYTRSHPDQRREFRVDRPNHTWALKR